MQLHPGVQILGQIGSGSSHVEMQCPMHSVYTLPPVHSSTAKEKRDVNINTFLEWIDKLELAKIFLLTLPGEHLGVVILEHLKIIICWAKVS